MRRLAWVVCLLVGMTSWVGADVKVDEELMGPAGPNQMMWLSPKGAHFSVVVGKGTGWVVVHDGAEGPRFDEIIQVFPTISRNNVLNSVSIIYSEDGSRFGYVGRLSNELVVMADGKELFRLPATTREARMEFVGGGKRVAFSASLPDHPDLFHLWLDGRPTPMVFGQSIGPAFSRDASRYAYNATDPDNRKVAKLIVDGKEAGVFGESPQFTTDSQRLVTIGRNQGHVQVMVEGRTIAQDIGAGDIVVSPMGDHISAILAKSSPTGGRSYVTIDGKTIPDTESSDPPKVVFSPDGKRYAAIIKGPHAAWVVSDGKKGREYQSIAYLDFSPDSSKLSYIVSGGGKYFVIINGQESDDGSEMQTPRVLYGGGGSHVAYLLSKEGGKRVLVIDGKSMPVSPQAMDDSFQFTPDGSRYGLCSGGSMGPAGMLIDGQPLEGFISAKLFFSPDGKHVAFSGQRTADAQDGVYVDGKLAFKSNRIQRLIWSGDSKHLYWSILEQQPPGANPPYRPAMYVDGLKAYTYDRLSNSFGHDPSGAVLETADDGTLTFVAPVGDQVKRMKITPPPDVTIESAADNLAAAEAQAKADADAAKAKAAEAAAKAKEDAAKAKQEQAAARAKAKADAAALKAWKSENAKRARKGLPPLPPPSSDN